MCRLEGVDRRESLAHRDEIRVCYARKLWPRGRAGGRGNDGHIAALPGGDRIREEIRPLACEFPANLLNIRKGDEIRLFVIAQAARIIIDDALDGFR